MELLREMCLPLGLLSRLTQVHSKLVDCVLAGTVMKNLVALQIESLVKVLALT
jgi:hypothetical protein